jgi:pimeloyl-ACP methyl ester carboxylesterase
MLVAAGHRVLAPEQRGYSPGARPNGRRAYTVDRLGGDVLALADAVGAGRFDLIGHDWGAIVAWDLAGHHPQRLRSLTVLSVPHAGAVQYAVPRSTQVFRTWYVLAFQVPFLPEAVMRLVGAERAARWFERDGLDAATARRYAARIPTPAEMTPRINWYRAIPLALRRTQPSVSVPTLYCWGTGDHYIDRRAAERCGHHVTAPYRFEMLEGASHWLPSMEAGRVGAALLAHLEHT